MALLLTITCATYVQMAHARPFWTSTLQDLSNGIKNASMQGVLTPTIALWVFGSPGGLPSPIFGSVSGDLTLPSKWGCDILCWTSIKDRWWRKYKYWGTSATWQLNILHFFLVFGVCVCWCRLMVFAICYVWYHWKEECLKVLTIIFLEEFLFPLRHISFREM